MTSYSAYDAGLPCKNPNCSSHGKPHPNCRCYGDMAEGGEVETFCSKARAHSKDCQYFQDGGDVVPSNQAIPDDQVAAPSQVIPDDQVAPPTQVIPDDQVADPANATPIADEDVKTPKDYTTPGQQAATVAEGLAQGVAGPAATATELEYGKLNPDEKLKTNRMLNHAIPGGAGLALGTALDALSSQGLSAEDITNRQAANPGEHIASDLTGMVGSIATGTGEAALVNRAAKVVTGSKILGGMIQNGLIQGGNEVSKWLLGQGDPTHPVASHIVNIGGASLLAIPFGAAESAVSGVANKAMKVAAENKVGLKLESFLAGLAMARGNPEGALGQPVEFDLANTADPTATHYDQKFYKIGENFFHKTFEKASSTIGSTIGLLSGLGNESMLGKLGSVVGGYLGGKAAAWGMGKVSDKVIAPTVLKVLQSDTTAGMLDALSHSNSVSQGSELINGGIEKLFQTGNAAGRSIIENEDDVKAQRKKLDDLISSGAITQQLKDQLYKDAAGSQTTGEYAEGGEVTKPSVIPNSDVAPVLKPDNGVAMHYPEQNVLLNMAKGRVANYLGNLKPSTNPPKLAFDSAPDMTQQKKSYNMALDIANNPLKILSEIKKGTIEPEHVKHFKSMYPEVDSLLQKRLTERIVKAQINGEKPGFKERQGLSLFMGAPLSSEMTPSHIQAAQNVFAMQPKPQQQGGKDASKPKKSTSALSKSDAAYMTEDQARQERRQKI